MRGALRQNGLRGEEIVRHEGDSVRYVGGHVGGGVADHVGEILDDEGEIGVRLGEGDADVAAGAADVDDGAFADGGPGIAGCQKGRRQAEAVGEGGHGAGEALSHVRVRGVVLPYRLVRVLG